MNQKLVNLMLERLAKENIEKNGEGSEVYDIKNVSQKDSIVSFSVTYNNDRNNTIEIDLSFSMLEIIAFAFHNDDNED